MCHRLAFANGNSPKGRIGGLGSVTRRRYDLASEVILNKQRVFGRSWSDISRISRGKFRLPKEPLVVASLIDGAMHRLESGCAPLNG